MKYKKGQLLEQGAGFAMALLFIAILLGVGVIATSSMASSQSTQNPSGSEDYNRSITTLGNASVAQANFSAQLPTIGTIAGVGLIIAVLFVAIGAYVLGRK